MTELTFGGLTGTLVVPAGPGPHPTVLLLPGSGPVDRDSNHKRMRLGVTEQLADALAAAGVASYRYDKRGVGASKDAAPDGDWRRVGFWDGVADAEAALAMLRDRREVDAERIVLVGHSEGAVVATALGARDPQLAGLVLLAGSARPGRDLLAWQAEAILPTLPAFVRGIFRLLRIDYVGRVRRNHAKLEASTADVMRLDGAKINARWFREFLAYDPAADLAKVDVPVLAITGEKDLQADPADLAWMGRVAGGPIATHLVPDLSHLLRRQDGPASLSAYKREIREPVDPRVLELVSSWVSSSVD